MWEQIATIERIELRDHQPLKDLGFGASEVGQKISEAEAGDARQDD